MAPLTPLEILLRRDRWLVGLTLLVAVGLCWAWLIAMARDMYGPMTGASEWMMTDNWDFAHQVLLFAMWVVMMAGMMLPSAAPVLLLYVGVVRKSPEAASASLRAHVFAGGYLAVWTAFSLLVTVLQLLLRQGLLLTPMMETRNRIFACALLLLAGLYQLTPYKGACLKSCRAPVEYIVQHWKPGVSGAFRLGLQHGLHCLGCCWALMLLLFVGGVMNLSCMGLLTVFVLVEKLAPLGAQSRRISGLLIIALGIWRMVHG